MFSSRISVLILEDDPTTALFYAGILRREGADVVTVCDLKVAREFLVKHRLADLDILLCDLMLPDGNGIDFIRDVRSINKGIPILVISSETEVTSIIEVMKENVQDYLIKPIHPQDMISKIKYHLSRSEATYQKTVYEKEKLLSLEKLLDWYSFKNKAMTGGDNDLHSLHKNLFHVLRASLSQGAGFGILVQIIDIIKGMQRNELGNYILDQEVLGILEDNAGYAKKILDTFTEIEDMIFDRVSMEKITFEEAWTEMENIKKDLTCFLEIKKQSLILGRPDTIIHPHYMIQVNRNYFRKVVSELLFNAMKFSPNHSKIFILVYAERDKLTLSFINSVEASSSLEEGIPNEYRGLIFEPFFRLNKNIYESHKTLDFGIGLTLVRETIVKFGGTVQVMNLKDHLEYGPGSKIEFKVSIPVNAKF
ncbi:ATP-binding response regulator [Leptospira idonii]|uniref:Response regulator n=1 Tax=Leptospira idonii TaxID=1193500 RepID=A0A4R9M5T3_9LEPT|nr:response regulator [Leptospira idonii]TGN20078.1 response regulator [Leptospira idonii]